MKRSSTAWVFVSHSTKDLDKVRKVRNAIEAAGEEPILFFLKCLTDHDETDDLIKREIEARNFFLLCKSGNARNSKWVAGEVAHVKSLKGKQVEVIDLDADWEAQLAGIQALMQRATVFLSYAHQDEQAVAPIRSALVRNDFAVWDPSRDLEAGDTFAVQIAEAIDQAAQFGFFLHFVSAASVTSSWVAEEKERFLESGIGDRYIPILLDPPSQIGDRLREIVRERSWIDYSSGDARMASQKLLHRMGVRDTGPSSRSDTG